MFALVVTRGFIQSESARRETGRIVSPFSQVEKGQRMPVSPELLIAGMTVVGTLVGAIISQMPHILAKRFDARKRAEDQLDRWEEKAFSLSEKLLEKVAQLDHHASRAYDLDIQLEVVRSNWVLLRSRLEELYPDVSRSDYPSPTSEHMDELEGKLESLGNSKKEEEDAADVLLGEVSSLKGVLGTYLPKQSHLALFELVQACDKRVRGDLIADSQIQMLVFSGQLREDFSRDKQVIATRQGRNRRLGDAFRFLGRPWQRG